MSTKALDKMSSSSESPPSIASKDFESNNLNTSVMPTDDEKPSPPSAPTFPEGGINAWATVFGSWCICFVSFGIINSFGVYETYYLEHFMRGYSPSNIAWIGSIQAFAQFAATIIGGPLTDRYGAMVGLDIVLAKEYLADLPALKLIVRPFSVLIILAMMLTSLCTEFYQFLLCQGVLLGVACGFVISPALSVVAHYFYKKRAVAMSLASTGSPVGGIVYSLILTNLLHSTDISFGWAQRICGFLSLALVLIAMFAIRPTSFRRKGTFLLLEAFAKPSYYLQVMGLFLVVLGIYTPYFYFAAYGLAHGMSPGLASYLFVIINGGSLAGRMTGGFLAYRLGPFNVLTAACYSSAILLYCWLSVTTSTGLIVLAALFGASSGIIIALMMATLNHTSPHPSKNGTYVGQATFIVSFAGLAGTPITGALIRDSYTPAIVFSATVMMGGALMMTATRYAFAKDRLIA